MKAVSLLLIAGLAPILRGQSPTDIFEKAPPGVEDALRERVTGFYKTWMEGKFRAGEKFVAEDAQEFYYQMQKQKFESCEIIRIKYERDFNDAIVTVSCKGKWNISGQDLNTTLAHTDFWSIEKDLWVWTVKPVKSMETPFGTSNYGNIEGSPKLFNADTGLPKDFKGLGVAILNQVSVDKQAVQLSSFEKSTAVVTVKNGINGFVDVRADADNAPPGLTLAFDKTKIPANGEARLTLTYDPKDNKAAKAGATVRITIEQMSRVFPVAVTFAIPEETQKLIDKSKAGK